jgi:hypothetical protein
MFETTEMIVSVFVVEVDGEGVLMVDATGVATRAPKPVTDLMTRDADARIGVKTLRRGVVGEMADFFCGGVRDAARGGVAWIGSGIFARFVMRAASSSSCCCASAASSRALLRLSTLALGFQCWRLARFAFSDTVELCQQVGRMKNALKHKSLRGGSLVLRRAWRGAGVGEFWSERESQSSCVPSRSGQKGEEERAVVLLGSLAAAAAKASL